MHRYADENRLQMVLDLDDRDRLAGIRALAALTTVGLGAVAWVIVLQQMSGMDSMYAGPAERSGAWVESVLLNGEPLTRAQSLTLGDHSPTGWLLQPDGVVLVQLAQTES